MKKTVIDREETGRKIQHVMEAHGHTIRSLSAEMGLTYQAVHYYLSGKKMPTLDNIVSMAEILHVKVDDLLATKREENSK